MSHVNPGHHPGSQYPQYTTPMASHATQQMPYPQFPEKYEIFSSQRLSNSVGLMSSSADGRSPPPPPPPQQGPASAHPPPPQQPLTYYHPSYPIQPPGDPNAPARYPLPPHPDGRLMSGGRHKKEIKRRTKTGCLTCRKRRIKCDEGHPTCRNCQKSKRECLGYDPIFKPQASTTSIQSTPPQYSPMSSTQSISYPPTSTQNYSLAAYGAPKLDDESSASRQQDSLNPRPDQVAGSNGNSNQSQQAMTLKIEQLLRINGVSPPPPAPSASLPPETKVEIEKIYNLAYAIGMDKFFETRWFSERGKEHLIANSVLCDQFAMLTHRFTMNPQDPTYAHHLQITHSLEAIVIWSMLSMTRKVAKTKDEAGNPAEQDVRDGVQDAAKRIEIFESLITGGFQSPDTDSLNAEPKANGTGVQGQLETRGHKFWHHVHKFLTLRPDSPEAVQQIEGNLTACRTLLDSMENRDVIYSVMVARYYGPKVPGFPERMRPPETNDEKDIDAKLAVAKRLLEDEAAGRGTNQVVQRLCGAAVRSWHVKP